MALENKVKICSGPQVCLDGDKTRVYVVAQKVDTAIVVTLRIDGWKEIPKIGEVVSLSVNERLD